MMECNVWAKEKRETSNRRIPGLRVNKLLRGTGINFGELALDARVACGLTSDFSPEAAHF